MYEMKDHLLGIHIHGREKGCIAKETDEDDEEESHRKQDFHTDQTEGQVRDAAYNRITAQ